MIIDTFIGRKKELTILYNFAFEKTTPPILNLIGNRGVGKTSLIYAFLEINKERLNNNFSIYLDSISGFKSFKEEKNDLIIIDDFSWFNEEMAQLKRFVDTNPQKKIITISEPYISTLISNNKIPITGRIQTLELNGFSKNEIYDLIKKRISYENIGKLIKPIINNLYDTSYENTNPSTILNTISYLISNNLSEINFNDIIKRSFSVSPIVDQFGNPINTDSNSGIEITDSIKNLNETLLSKIMKNPDDMYKLSSREFELFVAELFEKAGYKVNITKATHDGGKDLMVAEKSNLGSFMFYVECKKFSPNRHVGINLLRELYGTVQADNATAGVFVTSSYFSKEAHNYQEKIKYQLSLKDYYDLIVWLRKYGIKHGI